LRSLVELNSRISISRQCELLGINRGIHYYTPVGESEENLTLMRLIDEQHLKCSWYGVGSHTLMLGRNGFHVNEKRVRRLMRLMGLVSISPGPQTSKPGKGTGHQIFPYLLRDMPIERIGQVVGVDITYIPMRYGFLYLVAFIDWYSRYVISWELSNSMDVGFCLNALEKVKQIIIPEIINSDQGSQFTSTAFTKTVLEMPSLMSMDGKGRCIDNVFTERLWRSLKYEEVYVRNYDNGHLAYEGISTWFNYYNNVRPHTSLNNNTPSEVFNKKLMFPFP
jgi:putative transposase